MPLQTYINKNKLPLNSQRKKNSFKSRPDYPHSVHSSHQRSNTIESHIPVDRELFKGLPHLVANFLTKTKVNRRGGLSEREDCVSFRADNHRRRFVKGAEGSLARRPSSSAESRPSFDTLFPFLPRRASKTAKARRRNAIGGERAGAQWCLSLKLRTERICMPVPAVLARFAASFIYLRRLLQKRQGATP